MIVVDIETSGTEPELHSILSIGAVDFDNKDDEFYMECRAFEGAKVEKEALEINGYSMEEVFDSNKKTEGEVVSAFLAWAKTKKDHTVGGQNPHFDVNFIIKGAHRNHIDVSLPKRIIDLHSIVYFHMIQRGLTPPLYNNRSDLNSDRIMEYAGITPEERPHKAINGARIEAEAFSRLFFGKHLYPEYKENPVPWTREK